MPPLITNLTPITELEAVNAMLSAAGEAPLPSGTDLSATDQPDVETALNILRDATREVQGMKWTFNTEFGFELAPVDTYNWQDTSGEDTLLNIFTPPAGLISFEVTKITDQAGSRSVDAILRKSRKYTQGAPAVAVLVFYDRERARDGFKASEHPFLYIDPVWMFDFEDLPDTARRFITILSARRFVEQRVGSDTLSTFTKNDERLALRNLKRDHGIEPGLNMLNSLDVSRVHYRRTLVARGTVYLRKNRNSV